MLCETPVSEIRSFTNKGSQREFKVLHGGVAHVPDAGIHIAHRRSVVKAFPELCGDHAATSNGAIVGLYVLHDFENMMNYVVLESQPGYLIVGRRWGTLCQRRCLAWVPGDS